MDEAGPDGTFPVGDKIVYKVTLEPDTEYVLPDGEDFVVTEPKVGPLLQSIRIFDLVA